MSIAVLGAGAFGTALAITLARGGAEVTLVGRDPDTLERDRENRARLPGFEFPENLRLGQRPDAETVLLAVPTQSLSNVLADNQPLGGAALVACCKGVDLASGQGPSGVITAAFPNSTPAVLTGPSFAKDIAAGLPTALTLACKDEALGKALQRQLSTPGLRLYRSEDVTGAELGGALKNVIAIACGAAYGANLGASAKAALMTRGFAEMQRFALARGARAETLAGLSGLGDLALTCGSDASRNFAYGAALGAGRPFDPKITVEGAATAKALRPLSQSYEISMPIAAAVADLTEGKTDVHAAIASLLARPLTEE